MENVQKNLQKVRYCANVRKNLQKVQNESGIVHFSGLWISGISGKMIHSVPFVRISVHLRSNVPFVRFSVPVTGHFVQINRELKSIVKFW